MSEEQLNKLFVGNLPYSTTSEELGGMFKAVEGIEVTDAVVIMDRERNRSKGFGFVTVATPEMAEMAINALNNKDMDGRPLSVSIARPMQPRNNDRGGFRN